MLISKCVSTVKSCAKLFTYFEKGIALFAPNSYGRRYIVLYSIKLKSIRFVKVLLLGFGRKRM